MTSRDRIMHLVGYDSINDFAELGWQVVDEMNGTSHGHFAVLMEYFGPDADPPLPEKQEAL